MLPEYVKGKIVNGLTWGTSAVPSLMLDGEVSWQEVPCEEKDGGKRGMMFDVEMFVSFRDVSLLVMC